jgi:hypothetical protein
MAVLFHETQTARGTMTVHALNNQEVAMFRQEIEMLMKEREKLLHVAGAAAVLVANLDTTTLPEDQDTIEAAEMLAESINALPEESLKDALSSVHAMMGSNAA